MIIWKRDRASTKREFYWIHPSFSWFMQYAIAFIHIRIRMWNKWCINVLGRVSIFSRGRDIYQLRRPVFSIFFYIWNLIENVKLNRIARVPPRIITPQRKYPYKIKYIDRWGFSRTNLNRKYKLFSVGYPSGARFSPNQMLIMFS